MKVNLLVVRRMARFTVIFIDWTSCVNALQSQIEYISDDVIWEVVSNI